MPFVKKINEDFIIENDHIKLSSNYFNNNAKKFKKITGTRFSAILGCNKFQTPFKTWCQMVNIYIEKMDSTLSTVGQIIEPKIRDYVSQLFRVNFCSYNPAAVKWDVFANIDDVFGGIPDGEPIDNNGNLIYKDNYPMLEIKTSSIDKFVYEKVDGCLQMQKDTNGLPLVKIAGAKKAEWFDSHGQILISNEYKFQLALYLYLRKINYGLFAIAFLETKDYVFPTKFIPTSSNVFMVKFCLKNGIQSIQTYIDNARDWYKDHIKTGISPKLTESDKIWLNEAKILTH